MLVPPFEKVKRLDDELRMKAIPNRYSDPEGIEIIDNLDQPSIHHEGSQEARRADAYADDMVGRLVMMGPFESIEFDDS